MFDSKTTLTGRLTDAVDLLIDFATLGEYGLEPCESTAAPCQARRRPRHAHMGAQPHVAERGRGVAAQA